MATIKNYSYTAVLKYTAAGMLLGIMMVVNALLLNYEKGFNEPWFHIFDYSPDFIIIILCPFILGLLFCFIGIRWQQLVAFNRQIKYNLTQEQMTGSVADQQLKLLGKVMAQINEAVMIADNAGHILWINEGFTRITGYSSGEVIGKKPETFLLGPLIQENAVGNSNLNFFKGEAIVEEMMHYRKDGSTYWAQISVKPIHNDTGTVIHHIAIGSDITKRKLTELALKKSEEEKAAVLNNAQAVICLHDFNGTILDINIAAEKLSGYTKNELIGSNMKSIVSTEYQQYFDIYLSEITTEKVAGGSLQIITKNGQKRAWLYQNIVYDNKIDNPYIIASAVDITESVKAQNEIERQQQFIRQIIDNSPNMVFVMNEQQQIILSNKTFCKYYDYNQKEIPFASSLSKGADDIFLGDIESMLDLEEGEMIRFEGSIAENDISNSVSWFNIIKKCFKEKSGKKYFLGFGMDITGRYQVETDLIAANEMVERSLKVKDQFIANMSHEIRTPLNAVIGFTDLLAQTVLNTEQGEYIQIVKSASHNLLALINNILDLSKIESGSLELDNQPMDVKQIITDAVKIMEPKAIAKGIKMKTNISANLPAKVMGDQLRLSQILFNLLGNAVKFTDAGYVEIACKMVNGSDEQKQYISFSVRDTGIGVPVEKQDIIFERFTQATPDTERLYGGTGLGLNIAKSIVDMYGGKLTLESLPGQGTVFQFILSFKKIEEAGTEVKDTHSAADGNSLLLESATGQILLAEDNLINAMLAKKVLENKGFTVTHVTNGLQAVEAVRQQCFDVVLMDIQMPLMDGITATKNIRKLKGPAAKQPIVAMTAHSLYGEMQNCYNAGMTGYVSKPFKSENLFAAIREAITVQNDNKKQNNTIDNMAG